MHNNRGEAFVSYVIKRINDSDGKSFAAKLKRAESESTEYQSWEILTHWADLDSETQRKAFGIIGASIAHQALKQDGTISLGKGLRLSAKDITSADKLAKSSEASRLRRLISCKSGIELANTVKPIIRLLESRDITICYSRLLNEILFFDSDISREKTCINWAQDFFGRRSEEEK
ncbi:MAG: type I-E CRISPR-associated protein Cse2/CasB [Sphaerochaetaceae bacterium]